MRFRRGQKVVCVRSLPYAPKFPWRAFPRLGATYFIRGYRPDYFPSVLLEEIVNAIGLDGYEAGFWEERFAPINVRDTDISCFTAMLDKTPEEVLMTEIGAKQYGKRNWVKA